MHERQSAFPDAGDHMAQPWTVPPEPDPASITVELEYEFAIDAMPAESLQFAIEKPSSTRFWLTVERSPSIRTEAIGR